jgi:hypothetical protein
LDLEPYLREKKAEGEQVEHDLSEVMLTTDYLGENNTNYNTRSVDYTIFLQSEYVSLPQLKRYLNNLTHIGYELGIYGLFLAAKTLRERLKSTQVLDLISDPRGKQLFDDSVRRIDCLVDDILNGLVDINYDNNEILFSSKVLKLFQRIHDDISKHNLGRCIVFVERIETTYVLSEVLTFLSERLLPLNNDRPKIKYLTGPRANLGKAKMTAKYLVRIIFSI